MKGPHRTETERSAGGRAGGEAGEGETQPAEPAAAETAPGNTASGEAEPATIAAAVGEPEVDYKDRWLRTEADLQNFRRRSQRDLEEAVRFNEERLMLEMISQLDDLERALEVATEAGAPEPWVQGVRLVASRMIEFLTRQGVTPLDPAGEPFDPEFQEAMLEVDAPESTTPGHVVQVVRKGYRRSGRALRPARVVVARRAAGGS